jgi:hypothetical protein
MTMDRTTLHRLVGLLPERELETAEHVLRALVTHARLPDALANAPEDDEPLTEEDILALTESRADILAGRLYSHEEVKRFLLGEE